MKLVILAVCAAFFLCNNMNDSESEGVSYNEALSSQFISFEVGGRKIVLTEFKSDPWPFGDRGIITYGNNLFDERTEYPVRRSIYAKVPEAQAVKGHIETFGISFNKVFLKADVDTSTNRVVRDEQFRNEFLSVGRQNQRLSNFAYHQTYVIAAGIADSSSLSVTEVKPVRGSSAMILVSGEFGGKAEPDYFGKIENGKFRVVLQN